jgi:2'-5' RNA ligase
MAGADGDRRAKARVFFALWPDSAVQAALYRHGQHMHRALGGKLTRADSVHLTLLFLGDVEAGRLPAVQAIGAAVRFAPFSMTVDTARCWRHNDIGWVGPSRIPGELHDLVGQLQSGASAAGFELDPRPHAAHITLLRKARCRPLDLEALEVEWQVDGFVLVRSQLHPDGSRYTVMERWPA